MTFPPGTRLGPYEIRSANPVAGLGEVYDARDHERGRDVSLRVLHTNFGGDPERRQRFARESGAAALLDHPHILTVHDVGADAQAAYIVSDPITGRTLREVLDGGPILPGAGAPFVPQIRDAVAAAHARGVAHGSLTPDAIIREPGACCRTDIWAIDVSSGARTQLTSTAGSKSGVVWSPDGNHVAFSAAPDGSWNVYETSSDGAGNVRPLLTTALEEVSWDWAPTGVLLYAGDRVGNPQGPHLDLWARRLPGGRPFTYLRSVHRATLPSLAPDGRWIAFMLQPTGAADADVYVARFPKYNGRLRLSAGGEWPRWRGTTIFYVDTRQRLVSVPVSFNGSRIALGTASRVGALLVKHGSGYSYDVSPDGRRILLNTVRGAPLALSRESWRPRSRRSR